MSPKGRKRTPQISITMIVKIETYFEISGPGAGQLPIELIKKSIKEKISSLRLEFLFRDEHSEQATNRIVQLTENEAFNKLSTSLSSKKK